MNKQHASDCHYDHAFVPGCKKKGKCTCSKSEEKKCSCHCHECRNEGCDKWPCDGGCCATPLVTKREEWEKEFDEEYSACEDGDDRLLCTHESHKEALKAVIQKQISLAYLRGKEEGKREGISLAKSDATDTDPGFAGASMTWR